MRENARFFHGDKEHGHLLEVKGKRKAQKKTVAKDGDRINSSWGHEDSGGSTVMNKGEMV